MWLRVPLGAGCLLVVTGDMFFDHRQTSCVNGVAKGARNGDENGGKERRSLEKDTWGYVGSVAEWNLSSPSVVGSPPIRWRLVKEFGRGARGRKHI